jgi:hypothetical protein
MTVEKLPASTRAAGALGRHGACAPPTSPDCADKAGTTDAGPTPRTIGAAGGDPTPGRAQSGAHQPGSGL